MKVKKGQLLNVEHARKGNFKGIAIENFDTETKTFYPIALAQKPAIKGMANEWLEGEVVPCRNSLCAITKINK